MRRSQCPRFWRRSAPGQPRSGFRGVALGATSSRPSAGSPQALPAAANPGLPDAAKRRVAGRPGSESWGPRRLLHAAFGGLPASPRLLAGQVGSAVTRRSATVERRRQRRLLLQARAFPFWQQGDSPQLLSIRSLSIIRSSPCTSHSHDIGPSIPLMSVQFVGCQSTWPGNRLSV